MDRLERLVDTEIPVPVWIFPPTVRNWLEKLWAWEKYPKFRRSLITGSVLTVSSLVVWIFIRLFSTYSFQFISTKKLKLA